MPEGQEDKAREFYAGVLGMVEIAKPPELADRGGAWFASGAVSLHLGVEVDFRPARKAHVAFRCSNYGDLLRKLQSIGWDVRFDDFRPNGAERVYIDDVFGNRIELIDAH